MAAVIGHAVIEVAPDVSRFGQRLTRDLRKISSTFKKVSVGVSVGSVSKAFREFTKLNLALRAATAGFAVLGAKIVAGGLLLAADAAAQLSGALGVLPAAGVAAAAAFATLKIGLFGVDDAFKAFLKGDMEKFDEKLKALSPNARQVIGLLKEFKPALDEFKNAVQDALFAGLEKPLREAGTKLLPILKSGFVGLADEFNLLGKRLVAFSTSAQTVADVKTIFGNVKTAFHSLVPAGEAVARAIRDIVTVGSQFLPQIAAVIQLVAEKFAAFIAKARESGALEDFIGRGLALFGQLIKIIVEVGQIVAGVFRAARESGFSFLGIIGDIVGRVRDFVNSAAGQDAIGNFFSNVEKAVGTLLPVLAALGRLFNNEIIPIIVDFADELSGPLVTFIDAVGDAFDNARPGIIEFAKGVGKFLEAVAPALPAVGKLAGVLGGILGKVLERLGPVLEDVIEAIADALTKALDDPDLVNNLVDLGKAFADIFIALAPLIPSLVKIAVDLLPIFTKLLEALLPIIEALAPAFKILADVLGPIATLLGTIIDVVGKVVDAFFGSSDSILSFKNAFGTVGDASETMVGKLKSQLVDQLPNTALKPAGEFVKSFFGGVAAAFDGVVVDADEALQRLTRLVFGIGPGFGEAGSAAGESFARGLRSGFNAVFGAAQDLVNAAAGVLNGANFGAAGAAVTRSFASGMRSLIGAVQAASREVAGAAGSALPRSPAKVGPLSGRGWTPFRGMKLVEGFSEGMLAGLGDVRAASLRVAAESARTLAPTRASLTGPSSPTTSGPTPPVVVRPGGTPTVTTGDTNVKVFIDGRELRGVVVQVVDERDRALRRGVQVGLGGAL